MICGIYYFSNVDNEKLSSKMLKHNLENFSKVTFRKKCSKYFVRKICDFWEFNLKSTNGGTQKYFSDYLKFPEILKFQSKFMCMRHFWKNCFEFWKISIISNNLEINLSPANQSHLTVSTNEKLGLNHSYIKLKACSFFQLYHSRFL